MRIRTEYTRQIPIRHWLPTVFDYLPDVGHVGSYMEMIITGYKQQRAWQKRVELDALPYWVDSAVVIMLEQGQEAEGFEWRDEPILEGSHAK